MISLILPMAASCSAFFSCLSPSWCDAAAGLFAGLLGVAVPRPLTLLILGVLRLLAGLPVLSVGLLLAALLLLAVLGLLLFGALLSLALLPLLFARFLRPDWFCCGFILERMFWTASFIFCASCCRWSSGVLLGCPSLPSLSLCWPESDWIAAVRLAGCPAGRRFSPDSADFLRWALFDSAFRARPGWFPGCFRAAFHGFAGALEALFGGEHFSVGRELRLGELVLFVGGLLNRVGAEGLVQHRR